MLSSFAPPKILENNPISLKFRQNVSHVDFYIVFDFTNHLMLVFKLIELPFQFVISERYTLRNPLNGDSSVSLSNIKVSTCGWIGSSNTNECAILLNNSTMLIPCKEMVN